MKKQKTKNPKTNIKIKEISIREHGNLNLWNSPSITGSLSELIEGVFDSAPCYMWAENKYNLAGGVEAEFLAPSLVNLGNTVLAIFLP